MTPPWVRTFFRLAVIISATCVVAVAGLVAFRALAPFEALHASSGELGNYLQTLGGIYAVLLAFVVVVVWNQFNEARALIEREASALVDLHRTASGLPAATRVEIQEGLRRYVDAVLHEEWRAMHRGDEAVIERVGHRLDEVWLAVHRCKPSDDCQHTVYGEVLSHFNELADLRTSRLSAARARVPTAMRILLYTGAVLVTGSIYLVYIPELWLHAAVTAALAGAIAHILYLIIDLDDAFEGDSQISKAAFERARASFLRLTHLVGEEAAREAASAA
ncbi:MAG TPA: DUF4239 domain-containing protein [Kofleriaceae bacterium]|nr:DUF4239 domain-containing protein [Kofleriaceae bacterium]